MGRTGIIYRVISPSGKSYIGKTVQDFETRWYQHVNRSMQDKSSCICFAAAIKKYGHENFSKEILMYCDVSQINQYEKKAISLYNTMVPNGYNLTEGGEGVIPTDDIKDKFSAAKRIYNDWGLPRGIYQINFKSKTVSPKLGFIVRLPEYDDKVEGEQNTFSFVPFDTYSSDEIEELVADKYLLAIERYDQLIARGKLSERVKVPPNEKKSKIKMPIYIITTKLGYAVRIPGKKSFEFENRNFTRRQNMIKALAYYINNYLYYLDYDELTKRTASAKLKPNNRINSDLAVKLLDEAESLESEEEIQRLNGNGA